MTISIQNRQNKIEFRSHNNDFKPHRFIPDEITKESHIGKNKKIITAMNKDFQMFI